jgi:multidrug transporter EmrE-like cation transporter
MTPESTNPAKGLLALVALTAVILIVSFFLSSCATLESIPFSVSYQLEDGSSITVTKPLIIREK